MWMLYLWDDRNNSKDKLQLLCWRSQVLLYRLPQLGYMLNDNVLPVLAKIFCSLVLMIVSWLLLCGDKVGEENFNVLQIFLFRLCFSKKLPLNLASGMLCNRTHSIRNYDPLEQLCWIQTASFKSRKNARSRHLFRIPRFWAEPSRGGWMAFTTPNLQTLQQELPRATGCVVH